MKKLLRYIFPLLILIFVYSCTEECKTIIKYKNPVLTKFKIGQKIPAYQGYSLELNKIIFAKVVSPDVNSSDSILKAISADFYLIDETDSTKVNFNITQGEQLGFGNTSGNYLFRHFKVLCNIIDETDSSTTLSLYDASYLIDCSDWE